MDWYIETNYRTPFQTGINSQILHLCRLWTDPEPFTNEIKRCNQNLSVYFMRNSLWMYYIRFGRHAKDYCEKSVKARLARVRDQTHIHLHEPCGLAVRN